MKYKHIAPKHRAILGTRMLPAALRTELSKLPAQVCRLATTTVGRIVFDASPLGESEVSPVKILALRKARQALHDAQLDVRMIEHTILEDADKQLTDESANPVPPVLQ